MKPFGIYIVGNDKVCDHMIALVNSLRYYNPAINLTLIPYTDDYENVVDACEIEVFPDLDLLEELDQRLQDTFSLPEAPGQANKYPRLKNLATWFGQYETFVSLDADIVAFTDIEQFALELLGADDFACYDRTYKHGVKWVFTKKIHEVFTPIQTRKVFNNGFWVSRRELFTLEQLWEHLKHCKELYEYFDFASGVIAQPIINYLVLTHLDPKRIHNGLQEDPSIPEPWAGFKYEEIFPHILGTEKEVLPFLHWAGKEICENNRYWEIWKYYFNLGICDASSCSD